MPRSMLALGGAAVAVVVAVVALNGLVKLPGSGTGSPGASATPRPGATGPIVVPTDYYGDVLEGPFALVREDLPVTITVPAPGWYGETGGGILLKEEEENSPAGAGLITFVGRGFSVPGDPCRWSTTKPETLATTVDEFAAALQAQASRDASEPVDVTVAGHSGKSIILHVPEDADFSTCDDGFFVSWGDEVDDVARYQQYPGQIDKVWIIDVDGTMVVLDTSYGPDTPPALLDELDAIALSMTFE